MSNCNQNKYPFEDAGRTRVNSMQIVQVRREAESFNGAIDILLNMRSRVCDRTVPEDVEATLRSN